MEKMKLVLMVFVVGTLSACSAKVTNTTVINSNEAQEEVYGNVASSLLFGYTWDVRQANRGFCENLNNPFEISGINVVSVQVLYRFESGGFGGATEAFSQEDCAGEGVLLAQQGGGEVVQVSSVPISINGEITDVTIPGAPENFYALKMVGELDEDAEGLESALLVIHKISATELNLLFMENPPGSFNWEQLLDAEEGMLRQLVDDPNCEASPENCNVTNLRR